jgi:MSHA biogenesis protein MshL
MSTSAKAVALFSTMMLVGCGMQPPKVESSHIRVEEQTSADNDIPPAVQIAPMLPRPKAVAKPETYSVVVSNVRVQELLFALARDAKLNVDVHPGVTGNVTLNAIDQTLPQLLNRISKQVDMRYEMDGPNLIVMRDTPHLRNYRIDYVNIARNTTSLVSLSTQVAGGGAAGGGGGAGTNSTSTISSTSNNRFWETLVGNVKDILRETDRVVSTSPPATPTPAAPQPGALQPQQAAAGGVQPVANAPAAAAQAQFTEFREAASVISNPEAGVLSIRATSRQHERIQAFLDQVMASAKRQVLIEATIVEVLLNNNYQRGIDWSRMRTPGRAGFQFQQSSVNTPAAISSNAFVAGYALPGFNFTSALRLLESFGDVKVLSSPKMTVMNNHMATLRVADNIIYFEVTANTVASANAPATTTFTTTAKTVPIGFLMSVVPQISDTDTVLLNLRPTISRLVRYVSDPNPSLGAVPNLVPETQTREMESLLRVQSGQTAVLGGLIQDDARNTEDGIPGINRVPGLGEFFRQRQDTVRKTELVIFLRPTVIRDPSIEGDYRQFRELLPDADFLRRPNPGKADAYGERTGQ